MERVETCKADRPDMGEPWIVWVRFSSMSRKSRRWVIFVAAGCRYVLIFSVSSLRWKRQVDWLQLTMPHHILEREAFLLTC